MLTLVLAAVAAVFFYFGFLRPYEPIVTFRLRGGSIVMIAAAVFSGYFDWRDARSLGELESLIDPVPEMTEATYVPTASEIRAIAQALAAVPGDGRFGASPQAERRRLAGAIEESSTRTWILETTSEPAEIAAFYRDPDHRRGWSLDVDQPPWLMMSRGEERLTLFIRERWAARAVLYIHDPGSPGR